MLIGHLHIAGAFMTHILPINTTEAAFDTVGGKGRSLSRMTNAGFPVPGGFHITTSAYKQFVEANNLQASILDLARPEAVEGNLSFESASAAIQALFAEAKVPGGIIEEIQTAYTEMGDTDMFVAVRSSANAEDLPDMSFAGQQDTYLNIRGEAALIDAVHRCWASLWTARALNYRHQMGIGHDHVAMAVVIQRMALADVSGILFTVNPATGERGEMILNASFGLGEAIVSGEVTPDTYVVDRETLTTTEAIVGAKAQMVVPDGVRGTTVAEVDVGRSGSRSLVDSQIEELAGLALRVEAQFDGTPQDIEWVLAEGKLWLVQSRPITNLPPPPLKDVRWDPPEPGAFLGRSQLVEHIPDPVSPLFETLHMKQSLQHYWGLNLMARGYDYEETQPPACFYVQNTINGYAYRHLWEPPSTGRLQPERKRRWPPAFLRKPIARLRLYRSQFRMYVWFVLEWQYISLPRYLRQVRKWAELDPKTASIEQLWKGIRVMSRADARYWYRGGVWNAFAMTRGTESQLHDFLQKNGEGRFTSGQFLSGLKSRAFDAQVALWRIADQIRSSNELYSAVIATPPKRLLEMLRAHPPAESVCRKLDDYFNVYGHQVFTLDFAEPSQAENPESIMQSLLALVLQADYDPLAGQQSLTETRNTLIREATQHFSNKGLKREFLSLLRKARRFYPNREEAMFFMGEAWTVLRPFARELGQHMVEAEMLTDPEDIYFLTVDELGRAVRVLVSGQRLKAFVSSKRFAHLAQDERVNIDLSLPEYRQLTEERRHLREARRHLSPPEAVPGPPPWGWGTVRDVPKDTGNVLEGSPVSPGQVTAEVSLILTPADFHNMKPGTILVCPTTTPAWTQLFTQAKGLATDIGGILAHGAIVAREFGIPAVLGTGDITKRVKSGDVVTVDGTKGTIVLQVESDPEWPW